MQIGYISFCDKTAFNIKTPNVKEQILKDIYNISQIKIIQKHFEILKEHHFKKLNDNPHLISLKSNGNPYLLYLTKYNFVNTCIFIDKKVQSGYFLPRMIISRFNFPDELFDNTLLEGEMIKDNNKKWIFLINDIYIHKNYSLQNKNILKRLEIINNIFVDFKNDPDDVCLFQINKYFKYDKFNHLVNDYKNSLNYTCRGIYFKPLFFKFKNILFNFDDSLICKVQKVKYQKGNEFISDNKFKRKIDNKTDTKRETRIETNNENYPTQISTNIKSDDKVKQYYIENTDLPDVYNLYNCNSFISFFDIAYIPNIESSNFVRNLFINKPLNTKIKVECKFIKNFNKWSPIKVINHST
tara:strand:+ start:110 stop:1174 length:1065 start_codon:yes stop_codon:yes gene_type:complete